MVFGPLAKLGLGGKKAPVAPLSESGGLPGGLPTTAGSSKTPLTVNEFVARTKRAKDKGLEPTKPELIAYARYLSIDPIVDADLMWIAVEALTAPLPSEWTEHHDSGDRIFYYNVQTHASSWTHPLEQVHRDTYNRICDFRNNLSQQDMTVELERLQKECEKAERETHEELHVWTEHTDESGQKFYYNSDARSSVWTDPRPSRCHVLYLQMKALRVLSQHCGRPGSARGLDTMEPVKLKTSNMPSSERSNRLDRPKGRNKDDHASLDGRGRGAGPPADEGDEEGDERSRKKNKRRERQQLLQEVDKCADAKLRTPDAKLRTPRGLPQSPGRRPDKLAGGGLSAVEEVRGALGLSPSLPPLGGGRQPMSRHLLPDDDDGGINPIGHTKVRAGIRLQPLTRRGSDDIS